MPLQPGTILGSYTVTAKIGEGGMGEVYGARDTKLDRDVALKVPEAFSAGPDRLARFERAALGGAPRGTQNARCRCRSPPTNGIFDGVSQKPLPRCLSGPAELV